MPIGGEERAKDFIKFKKLTAHEGEAIEAILQRGVEALGGLNQKATLQIRVSGMSGGQGRTNHTISVGASKASLQTGAVAGTKPTLMAILDSETFYGIAGGTYSPVQAYLDGKLTLLGNVEVGKSIAKKLTGSGTTAAVCPTLFNESYKLDGPGYGTVTLSGEFFTPNGLVVIVYDWGGGFYQKVTNANSNGQFTVSQDFIYCGDIPGHPGVGVIVTATDNASGQSTTQSYATPC